MDVAIAPPATLSICKWPRGEPAVPADVQRVEAPDSVRLPRGVIVSDNQLQMEELGVLGRKVLDYVRMVEDLVIRAKQPGYSKDDWAPLAQLIAVDDFERTGIYRERMGWGDYLDFLTQWATTKDFETRLRRITEAGRLVFLEIEEHHITADKVALINSMNVYGFDDQDKIQSLDVYIQGRLDRATAFKPPE
jgi:hypothetical protein